MVAILAVLGCWFALSILLTLAWALAHRVARRAAYDTPSSDDAAPGVRRSEGPAAGDSRLSLTPP
jgi:hypothetical protein